MAELMIRLRDNRTGKELELEVDDGIIIKEMMDDLLNAMSITRETQSDYKLYNKTQGFEYNNDDTLKSKNTQAQDLLSINFENKFGGGSK